MSHADIVEHMMDRQLSNYYREQEELERAEEQAYDECEKVIDEEIKKFAKTIKATIKYYGFDASRLLDDYIMESVHSEVLQ